MKLGGAALPPREALRATIFPEATGACARRAENGLELDIFPSSRRWTMNELSRRNMLQLIGLAAATAAAPFGGAPSRRRR